MAAQGDGGAVGPGAAHHVSNVRSLGHVPLGEVGVERGCGHELRRSGRARGGERASERSGAGGRAGFEVTPPRGRAMRTMFRMLITLLVSQASGWLKAWALLNVSPMLVTLLVSHASGWLKALAFQNAPRMFVTKLVSQASGWLKAWALLNVSPMLVTLLVSHASGWLKAAA